MGAGCNCVVVVVVDNEDIFRGREIFCDSQIVAAVFIKRNILIWQQFFEIVKRHVKTDDPIGAVVLVEQRDCVGDTGAVIGMDAHWGTEIAKLHRGNVGVAVAAVEGSLVKRTVLSGVEIGGPHRT